VVLGVTDVVEWLEDGLNRTLKALRIAIETE
jgi:hypothetical protein